ncbi:MAG: ketopantoate reductase family protein [Anaerolineales bacterium]|nr:ketopantoate reductase family protein [Anaerolineales bacterium]
MKFLFFGAGAIGAYVGGSLACDGHAVEYVERPEAAEILRREGIALTAAGQIHRPPAPGVWIRAADALQAGPYDLAVFALKSYDTAAVVDTLVEWKDRLPPALCLQNGVENEAALEQAFGRGGVIAGTVTSAVGRGRTGSAVLERKRGIGIADGHPLSRPLAAALERAGLNARLYPSAAAMKWSKLLTNLVANASAAILGMPPAALYADPRLFAIEREMLRECLRVMRRAGVGLTDLPGTPVRALAFAAERLPASVARPLLLRAVGGGRGGKMPSLYLDLQSGRGRSEVAWLNGAVARSGRRWNTATPVNRILAEILLRLTEGREAWEHYRDKPENLLSALSPARIGAEA